MITKFEKFLNESIEYGVVLKKQQIDKPYSDVLFSNENSKFVEKKIHIKKLRELNNFKDNDEIEQSITYFIDIGMDEDEWVSKKLMKKIVNGIKLNPIVVDENYKILDGSHRLAAYSELYYYSKYSSRYDIDRTYINDFLIYGMLKIYKRVKN